MTDEYDPLDTFEIDVRENALVCLGCGQKVCDLHGTTVRELINDVDDHMCAP